MIEIQNLKTILVNTKGQWLRYPLENSCYYKCLCENTRSYFDEYQKLIKQFTYKWIYEAPYEDFISLKDDIEKNGYNYELKPKTTFLKNRIIKDGQHRMSILMFLYGKQLKLDIRRGELHGTGI